MTEKPEENNNTESAKTSLSLDEIKSKRTTAGVLGIFFGAFGAHKFVLGYKKEGFIYLGVSVVVGAITCGAALFITSTLALVESILLLTKTPEEFKKKYIDTKTPWF